MPELLQSHISKDILIGDLIRKYPAAIEVVGRYGIHCVGCHVSKFEALGMGLKAHGYSDEEVDNIIREVNDFLDTRNISSDMVSISEFAAEKALELAKKQNLKEFYLRLKVVKGGCAGNTTTLDFVTSKNFEDEVVEAHGLKVLVDPSSKPLLEGSILEYVESLNESGFKVMNPHAKKSCACGTSFMM